jgi:hypothetical protein
VRPVMIPSPYTLDLGHARFEKGAHRPWAAVTHAATPSIRGITEDPAALPIPPPGILVMSTDRQVGFSSRKFRPKTRPVSILCEAKSHPWTCPRPQRPLSQPGGLTRREGSAARPIPAYQAFPDGRTQDMIWRCRHGLGPPTFLAPGAFGRSNGGHSFVLRSNLTVS